MAKKSLNFAGLVLQGRETLVIKSFEQSPRKANKQVSLAWDVIKVNKKSVILQAYPTNETIRIKIDKV